ncbi:MAG: SDR family oxidoreductase [Burkholderiales bacterium]
MNNDKDTTQRVQQTRDIQRQQDQKDVEAPQSDEKSAVQAGARKQPEQLPEQHIAKPGNEHELELTPQHTAPNYKGSGKLEGFATLITGGDSGIGRSVAILFAREGADVAIVYLNEDEDAEHTKHHVEKEGRRCLLIRGDVTDMAFCHSAVDQTVNAFGRLDVLVNNAAFQEHADSIEQLTEERFDLTMRTNVYGYFHMAKAALPHMKNGASIINTGSVVGLRGSSQLLDYSTTKGAIHAFTKALAQQVIDRGIRVNAVAPGPVWTPLNPADQPAEAMKTWGQGTDMKRVAQPEELSPAYVFLAAPVCSGYITGIVLPITGSVEAI